MHHELEEKSQFIAKTAHQIRELHRAFNHQVAIMSVYQKAFDLVGGVSLQKENEMR
jgi:hypothetical protein